MKSNFIEVMKTKVELRVIERNLEDLKDELIQGHLKNIFFRENLLTGNINDKY